MQVTYEIARGAQLLLQGGNQTAIPMTARSRYSCQFVRLINGWASVESGDRRATIALSELDISEDLSCKCLDAYNAHMARVQRANQLASTTRGPGYHYSAGKLGFRRR